MAGRLKQPPWLTASFFVAIALGYACAWRPVTASVVILPFLIVGFFRQSWIRIGGLTLLAMQAFGSSSSLNIQKIAFISLVPVTLVFAVKAYRNARPTTEASRNQKTHPRVLEVFEYLWLAYLFISIWRSLNSGSDLASVFRDSISFLTWSLVLLWAYDLSTSKPEVVTRVAMGLTALAAVGTGLTWVDLRGAAILPSYLRLFPSPSLAVLGVYLAASVLLCYGFRVLPMLCLMASCTGLVLTGTRTFILVPVSMIAMLIVSRKLGLRAVIGWSVVLASIVLAAKFALPAISSLLGVNPNFLASRGQALTSVLSQGLSSDSSGEGRLSSTSQAWAVFQLNPMLGQGPGYIFEASGGGPTLGLDTPLTFPAKFGIVGVGILLGLIVTVSLFVRSISRVAGLEWRLAATGFGLFQLFLLTFGGAFGDKGLGLALVLLIGGMLSSARQELGPSETAAPAKEQAKAPREANRIDLGQEPVARSAVRGSIIG
jgi:hypothetical protein